MKRTLKRIKAQYSSKMLGILVILLVAGIGLYFLNAGKAATPYISSEAESGTLAAGATSYTDSSANGGTGVKFKSDVAPPTGSFVTRQGTKMMLDGKPFRFVGFGLFDGAASDFYKCGGWARFSDAELESAFNYMRTQAGATVVRVWFFQPYTKGGTDWTGTDKLLRIAKNTGMKVIPALENGQSHCTTNGGGAKWQWKSQCDPKIYPQSDCDTWYRDGYKVPYGNATLSYKDYVKKVVEKYKDDPTILGWNLMNEADTSRQNAQGQSMMVDFVNDMGAVVKGIDSNHLLSYGGQSNGQSGVTGSDYIAVNSSPYIDFGQIHSYKYQDPDNVPFPGSSDGKTLPDPNSAACLRQWGGNTAPNMGIVACSVSQAMQVVKKPVIIGEIGMAAGKSNVGGCGSWAPDAYTDTPYSIRATNIGARMKAFFDAGGSGVLIWQFNKSTIDCEKFDVLQTNNDPLIPVMKQWGDSF